MYRYWFWKNIWKIFRNSKNKYKKIKLTLEQIITVDKLEEINYTTNEDIELLPGDSVIIPTGIQIALPEGYEGQIRGRSGLNCNHDIVCPVGTIDADYRGELKVKLYNLGKRPYIIKPQERVAQLVICPVVQAKWNEVEHLECDTERGNKGFGSTGKI